MEAELPKPLPEPEISATQLWFLRILALACALLMLGGARQSGLLAAVVYSLPYFLGAWWVRPGTLRRGLAILALAGAAVGLMALLALVAALAVPPQYFDQSPEERQVRITALELLLLSQAALVIVATRAYFRTRPRPLN